MATNKYKVSYDSKYKVGHTYTYHSQHSIRKRGFRFYDDPSAIMEYVLNYYKNRKTFTLIEIEVLGDIVDVLGPESATNKFKVIRIVPKRDYPFIFPNMEFDDNYNIVYEKDRFGNISTYKYNDDGYMLEECHNGGTEKVIYEYDNKNRLIYTKGTYSGEVMLHYDENGNLYCEEYLINPDKSDKFFYKYDKNGNKIYQKSHSGYEVFYEYDDRNNLIHRKDTDGDETIMKYDENNNMIYRSYQSKNDKPTEEHYIYDKNGNVIYEKIGNIEKIFVYSEKI